MATLKHNPHKEEDDKKNTTSYKTVLPAASAQSSALNGLSHASPPQPLPNLALRPSNLAPVPTLSAGFVGFAALPSPICNGPASGNATIPPRPKPGRKPASDEPENKRKAQNRAAQRAFRERKLHGQHQLETENKELKYVNDQLSNEIQQRRAEAAAHDVTRAQLAQTEADLAESMRRETELRGQQERNMTTLTMFESRARDAEAKRDRFMMDYERVAAELHVLKSASFNSSGFPFSSEQPRASSNIVHASAPIASPKPVNGCGDCEDNGDCPCVDSYLESGSGARPELAQMQHQSSMSIDAVLSPSHDPDRSNSMPELISDHSSPEDMEIDFTHALKPRTQSRSFAKSEKCGFCEDGGRCICAEADSTISMPLSQEIPMGPPTVRPGTCAQCQQNPEQKAYCESLSRERMISSDASNDLPSAKRARREPKNVQVPCAEAFVLYKQYSTNTEAPSYDELYQSYVSSNPGSRRGTAVTNASVGPKPRQFSAYETDIASVIATLHRQPTGASSGGESNGQRMSSETTNK